MANTDERAARLAAQLRANLHRRKAQARAGVRSAQAGDDRPGGEAPLDSDAEERGDGRE